MEAKKILDLDLDLNLEINNDKYESCCENIDYILYRITFNPYLKKFIDLCNKYKIKYYEIVNEKYYIHKKLNIINQIKELIKNLIYDHINILNNINESNSFNYLDENHKITLINQKKINKLNKFIELINLIYEYKLLNVESLNKPNIDVKYEYDNLVNLSNVIGEKHAPEEIIIIDSYSW
jgi:hypothetical protein